ncbi:MAG: hypothetical protein OHK0013_32640 [Sandaracinaceae bacterium]
MKTSARSATTLREVAAMTSARAKRERAREARALLDTIGRKIATAEESFYEIGAALARLRDPAMFGAVGFDTFEALLASIPKLSREVAYRCLRIATRFDEPTALALSQTKALALLTYVDATPEPDDAQALAEADAIIDGLPISKQTAEGILAAAAKARPASERRARPGETEARRAATELERRLGKATGAPVEVRLTLRKGAWRLLVELPADVAARLTVGKR